ncbi:hypothetical protein [Fusibacter sp. JL216-2]|uniref:hypothetical protein n=1 Tax=Fusibacter sp. JL216-2 TaxID=3071453 RepID=UPI003D33F961
MSTNTNHLGLIKPSPTDYYDIEVFNSNADSIDGAIKGHDDRIADIENNFDMKNSIRSELVVTQDHITSVPEGTVSGGSVEICGLEGLSLVNQVIPNARFQNGVSNFSLNNATYTVDNNIATVTVTSISNDGIYLQNAIKGESNDSILYSIRVYSDNIDTIRIGDSSNYSTFNIELGKWNTLTTKMNKGTSTIIIYSGSGSSGDTFKIDGNYGIRVINLTSCGADHLTEDQLAYMVEGSPYWKGIRSVVNPKLVSCGKNKFDKSKVIEKYISSNGELKDSSTVVTSTPIPVIEGKSYTKSGNPTIARRFRYLDRNGNILSFGISNTSIAPDKAIYVQFSCDKADLDTNQLEEGTTSTDYEPYLSDTQEIVGEFRSLPNGVSDDLEYKRIESLVLTEDMILSWDQTTAINVNYFRMSLPNNYIQKTGYPVGDMIVPFAIREADVRGDNWDSDFGGITFCTQNIGTSKWYIYFPKALAPDEATAQRLILGKEITYRLAEPIKREPQQFMLESYTKGDIIMFSESGLIPEVTFTTPINQGQALTDTMKSVSLLDERTMGLDSLEKTYLLDSENPTLALDMQNGGVSPKISGSGSTLTNSVISLESGEWSEVSSPDIFNVSDDVLHIFDDSQTTGGRYYPNISSNDKLFIYGLVRGSDAHIWMNAPQVEIGMTNDDTDFNEIYGIAQDDWTESSYLYLRTITNNDAYFKNIILINMTALGIEHYTEQQMLDIVRQGYIKGTQNLTDLKFDIRGENLFVGKLELGIYSGTDGDKSTNSEKIRSVGKIPVKPNTVYSIVDYTGGSRFSIYGYDRLGNFTEVQDTATNEFTTISDTHSITFRTLDDSTNLKSKIVLVEGTTPPDKYIEPFHNEVYAPVTLTSKDNYTIEGGKMVVDRNVRVIESLDGIDYDWDFIANDTGFKTIGITVSDYFNNYVANSQILAKYNSKNITNITDESTLSDADQCILNTSQTGAFKISIDNVDSGWADSYSPTVEERNAYMNGWVMYGTGETLYSSGDKKWVKRYQGLGTRATLIDSGISYELGSQTGINECPKEKAYEDITETYKLQYALAEPVREEIDLFGDMTMPEGRVYVTMESGVRVEKMELCSSNAGNTLTNTLPGNTASGVDTSFDKKVLDFMSIIKVLNNQITDVTAEWVKTTNVFYYGGVSYYYPGGVDNDGADYYAVYKTLSEENNTGVFDAQVIYKDDLINVIEVMGEKIAYQAEQLDIAEMQIEELTKEDVLNPTWLNGVNGTNAHIRVKNNILKASGFLLLNSVASGTTILKTSYKPDINEKFSISFDDSDPSQNGFVKVLSTGEWVIRYEGPTPTVAYISTLNYEVK